eukprot:5889112-Amphidinium_carterae.3
MGNNRTCFLQSACHTMEKGLHRVIDKQMAPNMKLYQRNQNRNIKLSIVDETVVVTVQLDNTHSL